MTFVCRLRKSVDSDEKTDVAFDICRPKLTKQKAQKYLKIWEFFRVFLEIGILKFLSTVTSAQVATTFFIVINVFVSFVHITFKKFDLFRA